MKVLGVIPARYKSSRFEGKPLALIAGVPMLLRTYRQVVKAERLSSVVVATEDERIREFCEIEAIPVVMTSSQCATGTDRVVEVSEKLRSDGDTYDLYVNIQGDEPVIEPLAIDQLIEVYQSEGNRYVAYNLYKKIDNEESAEADTMIKVIVSEQDELIYMSRLPVPFSRSTSEQPARLKQVCVYGFTPEGLKIFKRDSKTRNERSEDIEILRFSDLGFKVRMIETQYASLAVDLPSDIQKVEAYLNRVGV